jgi:hypothetical protein
MVSILCRPLPNLALLLTGPSRSAALLPAVAGGILWKGPAAERMRYAVRLLIERHR